MQSLLRAFSLFMMALLLSLSCVSKKTEFKTPASYLNGEHYQGTPIVPEGRAELCTDIASGQGGVERTSTSLDHPQHARVGISLMPTTDRPTRLRGNLLLRDPNGGMSPLKGERIWIFKGDENLQVGTVSKPGGTFEIVYPLKNGSYRLCIDSIKYRGCAAVLIKSYEVDYLQIVVEANPTEKESP